MSAQNSPPVLPSISIVHPMPPVFPRLPPKSHGDHAACRITGAPTSLDVNKSALSKATMSSSSLHEDGQATPKTKERKALSESSLNTLTPPDSNRGVPIIEGSRIKFSNVVDKGFVKAQATDDVFGRSASTTPSQISRPLSSSSITSAQGRANLAAPVPFIKSPRPDRLKSPITPANAQGVLPPAAVVFAANLSIHRGIVNLETNCQKQFSEFGSCHVKVKKDRRDHPFAIIQYYRVEDAKRAIAASKDYPIILDGRTIRCEPGEARRAIVLLRLDGGIVTHEEAIEALGGYGAIETMYPITNKDALSLGLPRGMYVQFAYWQDYHDTVKQFNNNTSQYRIHIPRRVEARNRAGPSGSPVYREPRAARSATDQKSVFVGNLPPPTKEDDLRDLFDHCGRIKAVNIIHKPIHGRTGLNIFGFVEFSDASEAAVAATVEEEIYGCKIRIEPKEYSARREQRLQAQKHSTAIYGYHQVPSPYYDQTPSPYYGQALSPYYGQDLPQYQNQNVSPHGNERSRSPLTQNNASTLQQIYGHGLHLGYNPGYFQTPSPAYHGVDNSYNSNFHALSPYSHHQGGFNGLNNFYATPPPSNRTNRRNDMAYSGSPHGMNHWSPFIANSAYVGQLMQIPESHEAQQY